MEMTTDQLVVALRVIAAHDANVGGYLSEDHLSYAASDRLVALHGDKNKLFKMLVDVLFGRLPYSNATTEMLRNFPEEYRERVLWLADNPETGMDKS